MSGGRQARRNQAARNDQANAGRQEQMNTYYRAYGACMEGRGYTIKTDVLEAMGGYAWPGNVRELENHVAQAIAMAGQSTVLKKAHLLPVDKTRRAALEPPSQLQSLREVLVEAERQHLKNVLKAVGGHRTKAASVLGVSRKVLWEKLKDYGIE